jgi:hypothetical protein
MPDPPRPYDFLIEGEFLRTDIAKYLESKRISGVRLHFDASAC